ncbi:MAG: D-2-hydroxyacid dehydrogenase [Sphingobium sp.]|nr:D-2-hydroxyacid dehydrogenase [Sphingobium sp.]
MKKLHIIGAMAAEIETHLDVLSDGIEVITAESLDALGPECAEVEALAAFPAALSQSWIDRMPRLRWFQALTSGTETLDALDLRDIKLTSMAGIHGPQMAELAFFFMLAFARDVRGVLDRQHSRIWRPHMQRPLAGAQVVLVGTGHIAHAIAERCRAFGMRVTAISRTARPDPAFDHIAPRSDLMSEARNADYFIVITALDDSSVGLISQDVIAALPPHAVLINLARGPVVNEGALLSALRSGAIAGAGLDVFMQEPLPADSPFWAMPNVILTPHIGGWSLSLAEQMAQVIQRNASQWFGE